MRTFYYNITFACNSRCSFCASNSNHPHSASNALTLEQFVAGLDRFRLQPDDTVLINGGEPLLHPDLLGMISEAVRRGAYVILFTNGRLLADAQFARRLVATGVSRVTIPLYGPDAAHHERATCTKGSWQQTMAGLANLHAAELELDRRIDLELKTVVCSTTLETVPSTVRFVRDNFPNATRYVLSGLITSDSAAASGASLDLGSPRVVALLNEAVSEVLTLSCYVVLDSIPLCLLPAPTRFQWLLRRQAQERLVTGTSHDMVYFDHLKPDGDPEVPWWDRSHCPHAQCQLHRVCRMNSGYFDELSIAAVKPVLI